MLVFILSTGAEDGALETGFDGECLYMDGKILIFCELHQVLVTKEMVKAKRNKKLGEKP